MLFTLFLIFENMNLKKTKFKSFIKKNVKCDTSAKKNFLIYQFLAFDYIQKIEVPPVKSSGEKKKKVYLPLLFSC